jgi:hypothetical protein
MWGFLIGLIFINMNLRQSIVKVLKEESKKIEFSNLFKRKLYVVDQVIDNVVKQMYSCDYEDANEFFEGVVYDMSWLIRNSDFGLNDVEWLDIYDYLSEFKKEEILQYYTDRCSNNVS